MAKIWGPTVFGPRKPGAAPAPPGAAGGGAAPGAPAPQGPPERAAPGGVPGTAPGGAARRTGPLPSLAELGAFDAPAAAPAPRRSARLSEDDLRAAPAAAARVVPPPAAPAAAVRGAAAALSSATAVPEPLVADGLPPGGPPEGKTVPGVAVGWSDLNAAVEAGWIRPEAAHALWARWLARKPITRVEDDGTPLPPLPEAATAPAPTPAPAPAPEPATAPSSTASGPPVAPSAEAPPRPDPALAPRAAASPEAAAGDEDDPLAWDDIDFDQPAGPRVRRESSSAGAGRGRSRERERERAEAPAPAPEVLEAEILEPLEDANARRAAERAAQPPPTIEVVDVIEVPSLAPAPKTTAPGRAWVMGQFALALVGAVLAAVSVGLGSTLFGPWGGAAAAFGWSAVVWRGTARWHAAGSSLRALLGAHLVLPLLALGVWQTQVAMGAWPPARPMDLFADPPLDTAARLLPGLRLDWRWLTMAAVPLAAALVWLVRLRHPLMLASVTALLWVVAFQAVAGVLQAMGLSFQGLSTFMLMLGVLTLAAGLYIDLKSRAAGLPDYARWPYLCGAVLMGAGWVSMAALPVPVPVLRYVGWVVFAALAVSLARPSLLAVALAIAGFDLAWALRQSFGSDALGLGVWALWLAATAGLVLGLASYLPAAARFLRFWMPGAWRRYFEPAPSG